MSAGLSLGKCGCPNNNILVISFWKDLNGLHKMTPSPAGIFLYPWQYELACGVQQHTVTFYCSGHRYWVYCGPNEACTRLQLHECNNRTNTRRYLIVKEQVRSAMSNLRSCRRFCAAQWAFYYRACTIQWQPVLIMIILNSTFSMQWSLVSCDHVLRTGRFSRVHWHLGAKLI